MSTEMNKAAVRRWMHLLNQEDWEHALRTEWPPAPIVDWFIEMHKPFRAAFPDYCWTEEEAIAEGDKVMVRGTVRVTHMAEFPAGELKGIPATGKPLEWQEVQIVRFENGQIADGWIIVDGVSRLQQLGVLPKPD